MRDVAYIRIGTLNTTYNLIVPDMDDAEAAELIGLAEAQARLKNREIEASDRAVFMMEGYSFIFEFENEYLEIMESPLYVHFYTKNENYPYNTPTISVHRA